MKTPKLKVHTWNTGGTAIRYVVYTLPFKDFNRYFEERLFNVDTGEGEQRINDNSNVNKIKKDMSAGEFSPDSTHAVMLDSQFDDLIDIDDAKNTAIITLDANNPIPLVNGFHRKTVLGKLKESEDDNLDVIDNLPITVMIYLDGDPKHHFLNLQKSKKVDGSHLMSLARNLPDKMTEHGKIAYDMAKKLNETVGSPFHNMVRFKAGKLQMPVNTIANPSSNEGITSLVGTSKIAKHFDKTEDEALAGLLKWFQYLTGDEGYPHVFEEGKLLTPPNKNGTKGSATLIIGTLNLLLFYEWMEYSEDEIKEAIEDSLEILNDTCNQNVSGPNKRFHMHAFATKLFENVDIEKWCNSVPRKLVEILSPGCFNLRAIKKGE